MPNQLGTATCEGTTSLPVNYYLQGVRWPNGLERWTGDRVVQGSNPTAAAYSLWNFGNSVYPALPVSFGGDTKSRWSLLILSGVYARGTKRSHQSALECVTCRGLPYPLLDTSSWTTLEISLKTFVCYPVNMMCSKSNQKRGHSKPHR